MHTLCYHTDTRYHKSKHPRIVFWISMGTHEPRIIIEEVSYIEVPGRCEG